MTRTPALFAALVAVVGVGAGAAGSVAVAELRDQNGDLIPGSNTRRDAIAGTRMTVEPIPIPG
jgi:hypothetical protein